jgi:hypothetical protein
MNIEFTIIINYNIELKVYMTTLDDVAKGILIFCCGYFLLIAIGQAMSGQTAIAIFMALGFIIPFSIVINGYIKEKRNKKNTLKPNINNKC